MLKLFSIVALLFALLTSCSQNNEFFLDSNRAGNFKTNMLLDEALELAYSKYEVEESTINLEGDDYIVYNLKKDGRLLLKLEPNCEPECRVWRIWVYSDLYRTKKGIGVGSTIEVVFKKYSLRYFSTEGGGYFLHVNENDLGFEIDPTPLDLEWWNAGARFEDIPSDTKVIMIIV
jgi:hypothetical protein